MGRSPIFLVILARLAVSTSYHGRGVGAAMLRDAIRRTLAISEQAGIRALLTHPIDDDAARFYQRFGSYRPRCTSSSGCCLRTLIA
jgi:GNAT superfamily N-acetyltransferase